MKDNIGNILFDPGGGGTIENPGHKWFPRFNIVNKVLEKSKFQKYGKIEFIQFYNMDGTFVTNKIDYQKGYIQRTPDFDIRAQNPHRPISLVVDLFK